MKEYIERADIKALLERYGATDDAMALIDTIPAADVAEVKHGYWDDSLDGLTPYCSVCRCTHRCLIRRPIYCPNCGACMDKEVE